MSVSRNQYFLIGLVVLLAGIQLRMVDSFVLNERSSRFVAEKFGSKPEVKATQIFQIASMSAAVPRRVIQPPKWLGWCLIAVGSVSVLHALALKQP